MKRRHFLKGASSILALTSITGLYAWQIEPFWIEFVNVPMPLLNLPEKLKGKTLMQISDIHVGNRFDPDFLIKAFQEAQALNPDIVVYTGDFVSYENKEQLQQLKHVMSHAVKGKLASLAILGNHDYGKNWAEPEIANAIQDILQIEGITTLRNESQNIDGLNIIGIDDYWGTNFNPQKALKYFNPKEANLVLCHNPDVCDLNVWGEYNSWILSGHTHGGQCKPPFLPPPVLPVVNKAYTAGTFSLSNTRTLYINRALGTLWQLRFNVRPEITVFKLTSVLS
ncbi:MAG: phosphoesterase [Bacteroidetes bacterium MedPE-SWsnd-G2]|nr:MAG: phosphoesterase [Bacteroidetes bacterium MedPE-SWsnd-G2]